MTVAGLPAPSVVVVPTSTVAAVPLAFRLDLNPSRRSGIPIKHLVWGNGVINADLAVLPDIAGPWIAGTVADDDIQAR